MENEKANGISNGGFENGPGDNVTEKKLPKDPDAVSELEETEVARDTWGGGLEFIMSCIATSVGLGNIWRFPFTAYRNGGGAFLIPYIIVLILVGKPMYYLECVLGQFASRNSVRVWDLSPAMRGTGYAQALGCMYILTYYVSIVAITMFYLSMSFSAELPWGVCRPEWDDVNCVPSTATAEDNITVEGGVTSSQLYFERVVMEISDGLEGGVGLPKWDLTLCLLASWFIIFLVVSRGVKSSGKAAYFLAIFPYVVMFILLIRAATLEGAEEGILFFIRPQWDKLADFNVWYAATTQVFFSLSVCTGAVLTYGSYNRFRHTVYRDAMIVTTLDTFTSLMAGFTIFGILGNLAHVLKMPVDEVVGSGGTGLAFISYPDAISKFDFVPQLFAVLFFVMLYVLGIGSAMALLSSIVTAVRDAFPGVKVVYMSALCSVCGFLIGLIYVTPEGPFVLDLVDHYGGTFLILSTGIMEVIGVFWIYGLQRITKDIEFMLNMKTSIYWRLCWGIITPFIMIVVFVYALYGSSTLKFGDDYYYPPGAIAAGYIILFSGMILLPILALIKIFKSEGSSFREKVRAAYSPLATWGPRLIQDRKEWRAFSEVAAAQQDFVGNSRFKHLGYSLLGRYGRNK